MKNKKSNFKNYVSKKVKNKKDQKIMHKHAWHLQEFFNKQKNRKVLFFGLKL